MKPFFSRTLSTISDVVTLGPVRRRRTNTSSTNSSTDGSSFTNSERYTHSMRSVYTMPPPPSLPVGSVSEEVGGITGSWSIYHHPFSPSPEVYDALEDDVIFCKNNVCRRIARASTPSPNASFTYTSSSEYDPQSFKLKELETTPSSLTSSVTTAMHEEEEEEEEIEGYMYICTRGSDFGQTLILNWTPNNSMTNHSRIQSGGTDPTQGDYSKPNPSETGAARGGACSRDRTEREHDSLSLDLGRMESIRILYRYESPTAGISGGEVIIYSQERKYFIFSFKHNGLYDLIKKFRSWRYFTYVHNSEANQYTFTIIRPRLTLSELHIEEGLVSGVLTENMWGQLKDPTGRVLDKKLVLQTVFFRGVEISLRKEVWLYLLGVVDFDSSEKMRREKYEERQATYKQLNEKRKSNQSLLSHGNGATPTNNKLTQMLQQVDNDIRRTDRSHPFYKGEDNPNLDRLRQIILNYLLEYRKDITYCQGMTDILAPILMSLDDDSESFFCFTRLVERTPFFTKAGKRVTLHRQLVLLSSLLSLLLPWFFFYLSDIEEGLSLLFAHRWLLISFKREFKMEDTLLLWEACWTNYSTNSFHLFLCIAIMAIYGQKVLDEEMTLNELTVYFNGLANMMPVDIVLSQARGYLYQFSKCPEVPCVLRCIMPDSYWETSTSRVICEGSGTCCKGEESPLLHIF